MRKRKLFATFVPLLALSGAFLLGQAEIDFEGNYKDFQKLPPQTLQNHDFTFVRLMYNGRIPHYLKNWYTDYPTGDRNLAQILQRVTGIDVSTETRVIPVHDLDLFNYPMIYSGEAGQMVFDSTDATRETRYTRIQAERCATRYHAPLFSTSPSGSIVRCTTFRPSR